MTSEKKVINFVILFFVLSLFVANSFFYRSYTQHQNRMTSLNSLYSKLNRIEKLEVDNQAFLQTYRNVDPAYIHKELESFNLSTSSSKIQFVEKKSSSTPYYQETKERLTTRVQVDFADLKTLLKRIELLVGDSENKRPHLIISDFVLKKNDSIRDNSYYMDLELLKRDYKY